MIKRYIDQLETGNIAAYIRQTNGDKIQDVKQRYNSTK